jgi:hypothetical protein
MTYALSSKQLLIIFFAALSIRSCVMFFGIQPHTFYKQPDSNDYHQCAVSLVRGAGMYRTDVSLPIFWRTPGYPLFLAIWYYLMDQSPDSFQQARAAQQVALWVQIIAASTIPLLLFYLALLLTNHPLLSLGVAWIAVIHPGLVLASCYLLSEGIALIFFYLFLLAFYASCVRSQNIRWYIAPLCAAGALSIYTWMRPMGEFLGYFSTLFLIIAAHGPWKQNLKKATLFFLVLITTLAPWYIRNHHLTGKWFFCPTIGNYLNCFSVPKILRRTLGKPLIECHALAQQTAQYALAYKRRALAGSGLYISPADCTNVALPIIMAHPAYFLYDWTNEVIKTTFDLYSYQIIPMLDGSYWYDPLEEFLPEKIAACLWRYPMPWPLRLLCWSELLSLITLWIGLALGLWLWWWKRVATIAHLWWLCMPMIISIIGMTGGFGYARLRLPAEPLLIILSLASWFWLYHSYGKEKS